MNVLIIAPHPDDEVLGCGGTIAKYTRCGYNVAVCYVTHAYTPEWSEEYLVRKEIEIKRSNSILGVSKRFDLHFPAAKLDSVPQKDINHSLLKVISEFLPYCVFIPHRGDLNKDHRIVHDAALVALRQIIHRCHRILVYETLSETEWGPYPHEFQSQYYVNISDTLDIKIKSMEAFSSELKSSPHPRSIEGIRNLAFKRGSEILVTAAESFMLVRAVESDELLFENK